MVTQDPLPRAREYVRVNRLTLPLLVDHNGQTAQEYSVAWNARVYFVDAQGNLRFRQDPLTQSEEQVLQIVTHLAGGESQ